LVIDSITGPDLLFIIDSPTVAGVPFLIKDNQDEKRGRKAKRNWHETNSSNRIELNCIRKSLTVADGQRRLKNLEEGGSGLKTIEEIRRRRMGELDPILKSWKVARAARTSKRLEKQNGSRR
jgi:hypothetical protein